MGVAILGITGFQVYWLKQNYAREKQSLSIKTEMAFRETILQLQVAKLNLDGVTWNGKDSSKGKFKFVMHEKNCEGVRVKVKTREEIV
jgi:two-component system phosphate regulon sensor histidine kinase PhoR